MEVVEKPIEDGRWCLMEESYLHTAGLDKADADEMLERYSRTYPDLEYTLFWDEYYQYTEYTNH